MRREKNKHTNLQVQDSSLVINPVWPSIGASPNGIIFCTCCSGGTLEIQCPHGESIIVAANRDSKFCLQPNDDGVFCLDHSHAYYYQVQTEIFVCEVQFCGFFVCTFNDDETGIHIERIFRDEKFWNDYVIT